jgi:MerR family transcriptional regulator, light-induced transcriptional regulator
MTALAEKPDVDPPRLSIGALSRATGVPADTLRTWERRYGFPAPAERTPSGHRLYALSVIETVRLAVRALNRGHKPSQILGKELQALRLLAGAENAVPVSVVPAPSVAAGGGDFLDEWLALIRSFTGQSFVRALTREWDKLGAVRFLDERAGPLLIAIGEGWARGELDVAHEHFASEHFREFLSARWRPLSERGRAGICVCAAPTGEQHTLGLHMVATVLALNRLGVVFLGADVPIEDVVAAARSTRASAVALSASAARGVETAESFANGLLGRVEPSTLVLVGGSGFPRDLPPARRFSSFRALEAWTRRWVSAVGPV